MLFLVIQFIHRSPLLSLCWGLRKKLECSIPRKSMWRPKTQQVPREGVPKWRASEVSTEEAAVGKPMETMETEGCSGQRALFQSHSWSCTE